MVDLGFGSNFCGNCREQKKSKKSTEKSKKAQRKAELGWFCVAGGDASSTSLLRTDGESPSEPQEKCVAKIR